MTDIEKREALSVLLSPDTDTDAVLDSMISMAGSMILNKMYPFGYKENMMIPSRYEMLQVRLAAELYTQRGAEGQLSHSENGISRTWPEMSRLLSQVMPHCGSVMTDA